MHQEIGLSLPSYTLVKDQYILDIRKYSFGQRILHEWNILSTDCVNASNIYLISHLHNANSLNMFNNKIKHLRRPV